MNSMLNLLASLIPASNPSNVHSSICPPCRSIFSGERKDKPLGITATSPFQQTLQELQASAEKGCHLCYIRWHDLSPKDRQDLQGCTKVTFGFWKSRVGDGVAFEYFYPTPPQNGKTCLSKSVLLKPLDEIMEIPAFANQMSLAPSATSDSEQGFNLARAWIHNCLENHAYCNRSLPLPQNRILPSRLLEIGDGRTSAPRLCDTKDFPVETRYATLSHCWGNYVPLRLTVSTLEVFQNRLEMSALPQTFKDAMKITATLGIRYLWIDSLCIIQDSESDWTEQAAMMGDIYHNSWCNIAAAAAHDARDGCFKERSPLSVHRCLVEGKWRSQPKQTFVCSSFNGWKASVENTALYSRAWIVQELVLAPRVLYFGNQLYWECLELRASETYPSSLLNHTATKTSLDTYSLRHALIQDNSLKLKRYELWAQFVNRYSQCALSKPELDKLVAISGLARKLIVDGNQYVAGMWKEILPYQLMWCASSDPEMIPGNSYIPSWSWASMNKRIIMRGPHEAGAPSSILIRIIRAESPLFGKDPFGQIKSGSLLCLEGPIVKTTIRLCVGKYNNAKWWLGSSLAGVFADRSPFADGTTVFCLTIQANTSKDSRYGIILEPTLTSPGQFYRRGYFSVFDVEEGDHYVQEFLKNHELPLEPDEYEESLGVDCESGLPFYRISIV